MISTIDVLVIHVPLTLGTPTKFNLPGGVFIRPRLAWAQDDPQGPPAPAAPRT